MSEMGAPLDFSIIVPTYERSPALGDCLEALCGLDYPADRFEAIVIDDGSTDSPRALVESFAPRLDVRFFSEKHGGPAGARNAGARAARGRLLAFTADDCRPEPGWLRALAAQFVQHESNAVAGRVINAAELSLGAEASQVLNDYLYLRLNSPVAGKGFATPNNLAVPAASFRAMGGFDTSFTYAGEDRDFCARWTEGGRGMAFCLEARVRHAHPLPLRDFLYQHYRYGRGSLRFHHHRARRMQERMRLERPAFYAGLLAYPVQARGARGVPLAALIALSQAMIALGMAAELASALLVAGSRTPANE